MAAPDVLTMFVMFQFKTMTVPYFLSVLLMFPFKHYGCTIICSVSVHDVLL